MNIKKVISYTLGIIYLLSISIFFGVFLFGFTIGNFLQTYQAYMYLFGTIVSIFLFIGVGKLFVWDMVRSWYE